MEMPFILMNINMSGQFSTHIISSLVAGFIVAFPYVFWEVWRFIRPALHQGEQKHARGVVFYTSFLFISSALWLLYGCALVSSVFRKLSGQCTSS